MSEVNAVGGTNLAPASPFPIPKSIVQPQAAAAAVSQPAVSVNLGSDAATSPKSTSSLGALDPLQVESALSLASGANNLAAMYNHVDWAEIRLKWGQAGVDHDKAELLGGIAERSSLAVSEGSSLGLPITETALPGTTSGGPALETINVGAFSFTSDGSTYAVTPGADGTLIGTKDGQAWFTLQFYAPSYLTDPGATAALKTVTSIAAKQQHSISRTPSTVDISA